MTPSQPSEDYLLVVLNSSAICLVFINRLCGDGLFGAASGL